MGFSHMGGGLLVQERKGLRPGELLGIRRGDVLLPEEQTGAGRQSLIIGLGVKSGTKAKRAQSVIFSASADADVLEKLRS